jgi:hypothetical protein
LCASIPSSTWLLSPSSSGGDRTGRRAFLIGGGATLLSSHADRSAGVAGRTTGTGHAGHRALERTRNTTQPDINHAQPDIEAEHWVHLRTSDPIESTFSTVRLRTRVTKGPGSKAAGLAMAFKLLEAAQDRWRAVNGPHLVALVRAGARFDKGVIIERPDEPVQEVAA